MCLYPQLIRNRKYMKNKKNGGNIPPVNDTRVLHVAKGCRDCIECRRQKASNWRVRLLEDIKTNTTGKMVTLTFSDLSILKVKSYVDYDSIENGEDLKEGYALDNAIAIKALRLFNERWRRKFKKALRHWMVTELGHNGTENIHLHGIIWTTESFETIAERWDYGFIWPRPEEYKSNYVNGQSINYIVKYVNKMDFDHPSYMSRVLASPGVGRNYTETWDANKNKYNGADTKETYTTSTGHKISMPIYWRNKIYTDEEREQLWIQKLDKQERYVDGMKIDINTNDKQYWKALKTARAKNKELGYGNGNTTWDKAAYENKTRIIMQETRINNALKALRGGMSSPDGQDLDYKVRPETGTPHKSAAESAANSQEQTKLYIEQNKNKKKK